MEKFSLKDLQVSALSTFECYPNIDSLWAVENGMFFLPKQKGDAKDYAFRLKLAEPVEITRVDAEAAQAELEATAAPVVDTPTAPAVDAPTAPVVDSPIAPVVDSPTAPVVDTPTAPVVDTPTAPVVDTPTAPAVDTPTAPAVNDATEVDAAKAAAAVAPAPAKEVKAAAKPKTAKAEGTKKGVTKSANTGKE